MLVMSSGNVATDGKNYIPTSEKLLLYNNVLGFTFVTPNPWEKYI